MEKLKVVSLFSGVGGLDWGFHKNELYEIVFANDMMREACETYRYNFNNPKYLREGPIENFIDEIPDHNVLLGGFPCQTFSLAGKRKGFNDPRGKMIHHIFKILEDKKPQFFILENVGGIKSHDEGKTFNSIVDSLKEKKYVVRAFDYKLEEYGIPQTRRRIFFIGIRNDIEIPIESLELKKSNEKVKVLQEILDEVSIKFKLGERNHNKHCGTDIKSHWIQILEEGNNIQKLKHDEILKKEQELGLKRPMKLKKSILKNNKTKFEKQVEVKLKKIEEATDPLKKKKLEEELVISRKNLEITNKELEDVDPNLMVEVPIPDSRDGYKRLVGNKIAPTMMFGNTCLPILPKEDRSISVREAATIQTFPDDFIFCGGIASQYKQVGNAVPPKISEQIANRLAIVYKQYYNKEKIIIDNGTNSLDRFM